MRRRKDIFSTLSSLGAVQLMYCASLCYFLTAAEESSTAIFPECQSTPAGTFYMGTRNTTSSGHPCMMWTWFVNDSSIAKTTTFPDATVKEAHNYCREPTDEGISVTSPNKLGCFYNVSGSGMSWEVSWEECQLPYCGEYHDRVLSECLYGIVSSMFIVLICKSEILIMQSNTLFLDLRLHCLYVALWWSQSCTVISDS